MCALLTLFNPHSTTVQQINEIIHILRWAIVSYGKFKFPKY